MAPTTVKEYLASLPEDRRKALEAIRKVVRANLDKRVKEGIQYGMIGWYVPHSVYPSGYHCNPDQPLPFASLASQKNHMALYLFCSYCDPKETERIAKEWKAAGKRLDMGKSCLRFKKLEDVPLEVVGEAVARMDVDTFVAVYEKEVAGTREGGGSGRKATAKKKAAKKPASKKKPAAKKAASKKSAARKAPARKKAAAKKKTSKKKATRRTSASKTRK